MAQVLVIGGSGGIGSAIVRRYARDGRDVHFTYLKSEKSAAAVAASCADAAGGVTFEQLDIRSAERIAEVVERCGDPLEVAVFSAANGVLGVAAEAKPRHWSWTLDINARGLGLLYRATVDPLARTRGSLIALTSVGSRSVLPGYGLLGAAKAAMEAAVRYFAVESGPLGVRANSVCPGVIDTRGLQAFPHRERHLVEAAANTPLGRLVTCDEVANLVVWLTSDDARMITGQNIVIDGGWELTGLLTMPFDGGTDA